MSSPWSVTKPRFSLHFWFLSVGQISLTNQPPYPTILLPWAHLWAISPLRFWELKCPSGFKGAQYVDSIITSSKPAVHSLTHGEAKSPVRTSVRIMRWKRLFPEWPMTWTAIVVFKRGCYENQAFVRLPNRHRCHNASVSSQGSTSSWLRGGNNVNSLRGDDLQTYRFSCNSQLAMTLDLRHGLRSVRDNQSTPTPKQKDMLERLLY